MRTDPDGVFDPEHALFRETARRFIAREIEPYAYGWEATKSANLLKQCGDVVVARMIAADCDAPAAGRGHRSGGLLNRSPGGAPAKFVAACGIDRRFGCSERERHPLVDAPARAGDKRVVVSR